MLLVCAPQDLVIVSLLAEHFLQLENYFVLFFQLFLVLAILALADLALATQHLVRLLEHDDLLLQICHAFQLLSDRGFLGHQLLNTCVSSHWEPLILILTVLLFQRNILLLQLAHFGAQLVLLLFQVLYFVHLALKSQIDAFRAIAAVIQGLFLVALHSLVVLDLVLIHCVLLQQRLHLLSAPVELLLDRGGHEQAFQLPKAGP